jgi:hypothetical protein
MSPSANTALCRSAGLLQTFKRRITYYIYVQFAITAHPFPQLNHWAPPLSYLTTP